MSSLPRWRVLALASQLQRSSHTVTAVAGGRVFLFGGEQVPRMPVDNLVYEWSGSKWTAAATSGHAPRARVGHAAAGLGKWLYVFGGRALSSGTGGSSSSSGGEPGSKPSWEELDDLHRLDTDTLEWEHLSEGCAPQPRSYHAMAASTDGKLYVFGGCGNSGRLGDLHCYDTSARSWRQCPQPETALAGRGGAGLAVVEGKVYVIGGFYGKEVGEVLCYDPALEHWSVLEHSLQPPRSVFAVGVRGSRMYVFGGELDPSTKGHEGAGAFYGQMEVLDTAAVADGGGRGWQKLAPEGGAEAPEARGWLASAMTDSGWLLHGGLNASNERLSDAWLLELP